MHSCDHLISVQIALFALLGTHSCEESDSGTCLPIWILTEPFPKQVHGQVS